MENNTIQPVFRINKGKRKIGASGSVIEEEWITVQADNRKDCEEMFDKRCNNEQNN